MSMDPRKEAKKLGYKIRYVNHDSIRKEVACYNVVFNGKRIAPKAALERLHIPKNEIWISRKYKKHGGLILFHELREIAYRSRGYSEKKAHEMARKAERLYRPD
ncbi:MAG: hypothetical protein LVQ95_01650 [Candidatus Micrarchaeales archaeon]|nr:hypothetical protein [Candidatus Micrarchaeales archaeon]